MKKKIIILVIILILIGIGTGVGIWKYQTNKAHKKALEEEQEENYLFAKDVIHSLIEIRDSMESEEDIVKDAEIQFLRDAYAMREHLLNAKDDIEGWKNHQDAQIKEIASNMLKGINDLLAASDVYINIATKKSKSQKEDLAIFQVKLDEGRRKIMVAPINIGIGDFSLSSSQKKELISYIEGAFKKDIAKRDQQIEKGEEVRIKSEIVAALLIKAGLEGVGD